MAMRAALGFKLHTGWAMLVAVADYNVAYLYYLRGEYTRSIELYRAAREGCRTLGDAYREALCDLDQSEMYLELNLIEEGAHLAGRAQKAFLKLGMGYEAAKAQTNLAISLTHHGDTAVALELFHQARQLFDRENNRAWIATIDLYQALVYHRDHRLDDALELCQRALDFFAPSPLFTKSVLCQLLLARIHLDRGQSALAKQVCLTALDRLQQAETKQLGFLFHRPILLNDFLETAERTMELQTADGIPIQSAGHQGNEAGTRADSDNAQGFSRAVSSRPEGHGIQLTRLQAERPFAHRGNQ